jgi:hypothetical protein
VDAGCLMRLWWLQGLRRCAVLAEGGAVSHACCFSEGKAPIHEAAIQCHLPCLELLVAQGAEVDAKDKWELLSSVMALPLVVAMLLMASNEFDFFWRLWSNIIFDVLAFLFLVSLLSTIVFVISDGKSALHWVQNKGRFLHSDIIDALLAAGAHAAPADADESPCPVQ